MVGKNDLFNIWYCETTEEENNFEKYHTPQ